MNIIHIGLGKTGSTTLQDAVLPKISEEIGLKYWALDENILDYVKVHYSKLVLKQKNIKKINTSSKVFISHEGLSGFNEPEALEYFAEQNSIAFGYDTHILITIREPLGYLTSVYFELVLKKLIVCNPKEFFDVTNAYCNYDIKKFSYLRLIDEYKKRFKKVTVIKMERYSDISYLSKKLSIRYEILNQIINNKDKETQIKNVSYHLYVYKISLVLSFIFYPLKGFLRFSILKRVLKKALIHFVKRKFSTKSNKNYPSFYLNISIQKLEKIGDYKLLNIIFSQMISELFKILKIFHIVSLLNGLFFKKKLEDSLKLKSMYSKELNRLKKEYRSIE